MSNLNQILKNIIELQSQIVNRINNVAIIKQLPQQVTKAGNQFNGANQLLKLDQNGKIPEQLLSEIGASMPDIDLSRYMKTMAVEKLSDAAGSLYVKPNTYYDIDNPKHQLNIITSTLDISDFAIIDIQFGNTIVDIGWDQTLSWSSQMPQFVANTRYIIYIMYNTARIYKLGDPIIDVQNNKCVIKLADGNVFNWDFKENPDNGTLNLDVYAIPSDQVTPDMSDYNYGSINHVAWHFGSNAVINGNVYMAYETINQLIMQKDSCIKGQLYLDVSADIKIYGGIISGTIVCQHDCAYTSIYMSDGFINEIYFGGWLNSSYNICVDGGRVNQISVGYVGTTDWDASWGSVYIRGDAIVGTIGADNSSVKISDHAIVDTVTLRSQEIVDQNTGETLNYYSTLVVEDNAIVKELILYGTENEYRIEGNGQILKITQM